MAVLACCPSAASGQRGGLNVEDDCLLQGAQGVSGDAGVSAPPALA